MHIYHNILILFAHRLEPVTKIPEFIPSAAYDGEVSNLPLPYVHNRLLGSRNRGSFNIKGRYLVFISSLGASPGIPPLLLLHPPKAGYLHIFTVKIICPNDHTLIPLDPHSALFQLLSIPRSCAARIFFYNLCKCVQIIHIIIKHLFNRLNSKSA